MNLRAPDLDAGWDLCLSGARIKPPGGGDGTIPIGALLDGRPDPA